MRIYIPSRKRAQSQWFFSRLSAAEQKNCVIVVDEGAGAEYRKHNKCEVLELNHGIVGIGAVRAEIFRLHNAKKYGNKLAMVDDDIIISKRSKDPSKFERCTPQDYTDALQLIERTLDDYAHVTLPMRQGANYMTAAERNVRCIRVVGYDVSVVRAEKIQVGRCMLMEDFDTTLQLLCKGYANLALFEYVQDDLRGSGAAGGCSTYRTMELQAAAAHRLAELHPRYVKVVEKKPNSGWQGQARVDVRVQWKQAYKFGAGQ